MEGFVDFDPQKDIPSLIGKVIFITGGQSVCRFLFLSLSPSLWQRAACSVSTCNPNPMTYEDHPIISNPSFLSLNAGTAGLGRATIEELARHDPTHIYFTGRSKTAAESLMADVKKVVPSATTSLTFIEMDFADLSSVKRGCSQFKHDRLDLLMCNAGVMAIPPVLSKDGFEIQFAINHLGNAMVTHQLLPVLLRTADLPGADVRIVNMTSDGWKLHPKGGIIFSTLRTKQESWLLGNWTRYG